MNRFTGTWDDFNAAAAKLNANKFRTAVLPSAEDVEPLVNALGGAYAASDRTKFAGFFDSDATVHAMEQIKQMKIDWNCCNDKTEDKQIALGMDYLDSMGWFIEERFGIAPLPLRDP